MKTLKELLLEDFVLKFFCFNPEAEDRCWKLLFLEDAFPKNEVCEEIREVTVTASCGWYRYPEYKPANYIKN